MKYEVDNKPIKFHGIYQHSEIVPPSLLMNFLNMNMEHLNIKRWVTN